MPIFGEYETVEQISVTEEPRHITTVWKARKSGPPDGRLYAVKCYAPRPGRITTGQPEDARQLDRSLTFLEGIKRLKRARTAGTSSVAAVHAFGPAPEGAWFATDYCERGTLKEYIDLQGRVDSEALRQVVYSVITGCLALKRSGGGKTHGNLKPSNMLLAGKPCPLRKTPLHLTDPHPAPRQLAVLDTADQRTGGDAPDKAMEIQDLRAIGELILQLVDGRLLRNAYEYNYPVVRSEKWDKLGKAGESWRVLCNRLLDPRLSLEKESLEKLEREYRSTVPGTNLLISLAVLGGIIWLGVAPYFAVSALGKLVKGHRAKQEQKYQEAMRASQLAWDQRDYTEVIRQAAVALVVKAKDAAATKLRAEALRQLDLSEKARAQESKYQTALNSVQSALERKDYGEAIKQAGLALGLKPDGTAAMKLRAEAQAQLDLAEKAKAQEQKYQTAMSAGQSSLDRKDYVEAIQQAGVALGVQPNDAAATKLRAEAQRQLDLAEKAKAQELKYQTAISAGQSALKRKDYAEVVEKAGVALEAKPNDAAATKLRAEAQRQLDLAEKAKAQELKYQTAMSAGQSALERKDFAEVLEKAGVALEVKPNDPAATKLRAEAQRQLNMADNAKARKVKYGAAMSVGRTALERKDYVDVIRQAGVALGVQPNDAAATKLRAEAQKQLDLAEKAKAQELKYQIAMSAGQSALERKDYAEVLEKAGVALEVKPNDAAATKLRAEAQKQLNLAEGAKAYQTALNAGQSALERKDYAEVIKQASVALVVKPNDAAATKLRADARAQLDFASKGKGPGESHLATAPGDDAPVPRRSDAEIRIAVLGEIAMDPGVKNAFHDLLITNVNGRLTLRGHVKNREQRRIIGAAAERVVGAGKVDNQLETLSTR